MSDPLLLSIGSASVAAMLFGLQVILVRKGLRHIDPQAGAMLTIGFATLAFWLMAPWQMKREYWFTPGMWVFAANGLIHPMLSMQFAFEANKRMGATISSTISATAPLFAMLGAVAFLSEPLTLPILVGTIASVVGVVVLSWRGASASSWALSALFFPIGAAAIRGTNNVIGSHGLDLLPSAHFAATVSFTVSLVGQVLIYRFRNGHFPRRLAPRGVAWNLASGACITIAIFSMYTALGSGLVIVVAPVIASFPVFTLIIALAIGMERFSLQVLAGVVLVIGGVVLITLA